MPASAQGVTLRSMPRNFSKQITFDGISTTAIIIPEVRQNGKYYEVNIKNYPRFFMTWTALGRYDVVTPDVQLPYNLILAVSDAIEEAERRK